MSEKLNTIKREYHENVCAEREPRKIGLSPIPEDPDDSDPRRGMFSTALDTILTALRFLAPTTLVAFLWSQNSLLYRILDYVYSTVKSIIFSSEKQKETVLLWLSEIGPVDVKDLNTVWRQGWILCGVLDSALPGSCAGHAPTELSLKHAQSIADHYLGVEPVFSRQELESVDLLTKQQQWKLATYLDRIREALSKLSPPVSKPTSARTSPETTQVTLDYVARGTGLTAAQVNNKMYLKIYPTAQQSLDPGEITILIRGPKDTYGMTVIPPILGKALKIRQNLLGLNTNKTYTKNVLPITVGAAYLRKYGKHDMNKTFHIPKTNYDIEIEVENKTDHAKVGYTVRFEGRYEISITSRGQNILGSPFTVTASKDVFKTLEFENSALEDGELIDIVDCKSKRRVILRVVDFVTEKMLLNENGSFEKISDDEVTNLLKNNGIEIETSFEVPLSTASNRKTLRFNDVANKIIKLNKVCNILKDMKKPSEIHLHTEKCDSECKQLRSYCQQKVPDVVNSTFTDSNTVLFSFTDKELISIGTQDGSSIISKENLEKSLTLSETSKTNKLGDSLSADSLDSYCPKEPTEDLKFERQLNTNNPFINDQIIEHSDFEDYKYDSQSVPNEPIQILVEELFTDIPSDEICSTNINPFFDPDILNIERPKTPILKIISGELNSRDDSVYVDPKTEMIVEGGSLNEFVNPFFMHQESQNFITNFAIGAPVSLPPQMLSTPEKEAINYPTQKHLDMLKDPKDTQNKISKDVTGSLNSTYYSIDSNFDNRVEASNNVMINNKTQGDIHTRDIWDSAYVSIDDNGSPDSNNNESSNDVSTKMSRSDTTLDQIKQQLSTMGPAEREIWQTTFGISDLEEEKLEKIKRPLFTPIIEESDRSISCGTKIEEIDSVVEAFAELNDIYHEYYPNSESNSLNIVDHKFQYNSSSKDVDEGVNSASVVCTDVKRRVCELEGTISEVQPNATESCSASQILHTYQDKDLQFGIENKNNIVLERKKYWDDKIMEIKAMEEEERRKEQMKYKPKPSKLLYPEVSDSNNNSKIIQSYSESSDNKRLTDNVDLQKHKNIKEKIDDNQLIEKYEIAENDSLQRDDEITVDEGDIHLVEKWKKYWDNKLENEIESPDTVFKKSQHSNYTQYVAKDFDGNKEHDAALPTKELSEEIYKAFETSPKRFFGTSRKQIINKIDSYLGKSNVNIQPEQTIDSHNSDHGLVSSRISLFHNISNTDDILTKSQSFHNINFNKSQSLQNINQRNNSITVVKNEDLNKICPTKDLARNDSKSSIISVDNVIQENDNFYSTKYKSQSSKSFDYGNKIPLSTESIENFHQLPQLSKADLTYKERRARFTTKHKEFNHTCDDFKDIDKRCVKENILTYNRLQNRNMKVNKTSQLRKSSISKSEMDIFNKKIYKPLSDSLDVYKSYDELPKINVKSFISLYESTSKVSIDSRATSRFSRNNSIKSLSTTTVANSTKNEITELNLENPESPLSLNRYKSQELSPELFTDTNQVYSEPKTYTKIISDKEITYLTLSDAEIEIIENHNDKSIESTPEKELSPPQTDYKARFKTAKEYFQSLDELRPEKKTRHPNECELLLHNESTESLEIDTQKKRNRKQVKAHSVPSSELSKAWEELNLVDKDDKLIKISEKFNVDDLFNDVFEGRFSRQGSLRGIPHKRAVLETFRSMENVSDAKMSPYVIAATQLSEFARENCIKNSQTHLSEYPYLPTTDPSKYHSRLDAKATGLISMKELLNIKQRRNSVPELRLNPKFTVDL